MSPSIHNAASQVPQSSADELILAVAGVSNQLTEKIKEIRRSLERGCELLQIEEICVEILSHTRRDITECSLEECELVRELAQHGKLLSRFAEAFDQGIKALRRAETSFVAEVSGLCSSFELPELSKVLEEESLRLKEKYHTQSLDPKPVRRIKRAVDQCLDSVHSEGLKRLTSSTDTESYRVPLTLVELKEIGLGDVARSIYVAQCEYFPVVVRLREVRAIADKFERDHFDLSQKRTRVEILSEILARNRLTIADTESKITALEARVRESLEQTTELVSSTLTWVTSQVRSQDAFAKLSMTDLASKSPGIPSWSSLTSPRERVAELQKPLTSLVDLSEEFDQVLVALRNPTVTTLTEVALPERQLSVVATESSQSRALIIPSPSSVIVSRPGSITTSTQSAERTEPIHIRWLIRRDMPSVLEIEDLSFEFPWCEDEFVRTLRQRDVIGMVAERADKVAGFMVYQLYRTRVEILNFAVHPDIRRVGVGSSMVDKLISKLAYQRRNRLCLDVRETNLDALRFFRSQGFRATGLLRDFYENTPEDAVLLEYKHVKPEDNDAT